MDNESVLNLKTKVETTKQYVVEYFVTYVFRANFNDEMYLEEKNIDIEELKDKPLVWFDPYLGRSKIGNTEFAIAKVTDEELVLLVREKGELSEWKGDWSYTFCEDFDESRLLACHVSRYTKK